MKAVYKVGLALIILLTLGPHSRAEMILAHSQESVLAQSIFADLTVESVLLSGTGSGLSVAYSGTTTGLQWNGAFTDPTSGTAEGSIAGSITADPAFQIDSGNITIGKTPYTLSGSFTFDDAKGTATLNFNAMSRFTPTVSWKDGGDLNLTKNKDGSFNFSGTVLETTGLNGRPKKYTMNINIAPLNANGDYKITSSVTRAGKPVVINRGKATARTGFGGFDGDVDLDIDAVPEPSSLVLSAIGFLCAAGYRVWRKRIPCQGAV